MHGARRKPQQFGLLPDTQATICNENFPQLLDLACLPSFHRPQRIVVLYYCTHLPRTRTYGKPNGDLVPLAPLYLRDQLCALNFDIVGGIWFADE